MFDIDALCLEPRLLRLGDTLKCHTYHLGEHTANDGLGPPPEEIASPVRSRLRRQECWDTVHALLQQEAFRKLHGCICLGGPDHAAKDGRDVENVEGTDPWVDGSKTPVPYRCCPPDRERFDSSANYCLPSPARESAWAAAAALQRKSPYSIPGNANPTRCTARFHSIRTVRPTTVSRYERQPRQRYGG